MILDRTAAPGFNSVEHINIIRAKPLTLPEGVKVYAVNAAEQDIVRVEFLFNNINWDITRPLQAFASNSMLIEGTGALTASEIASKIDFYGAFLQIDYNFDYASVTLYTLNKYLKVTLPIVIDVIANAAFPGEELETFIRNQKQKLSVNLEKNDFLSRRELNKAIFGNTIYGNISTDKEFDSLKREDLISYHQNAYLFSNCCIIISGKVTDDIIAVISDLLKPFKAKAANSAQNLSEFHQGVGKTHYIERPDALQSAIRIGRLAVNRTHPDFPALQVLNTVLGGYFGSRLMANIREDKGYTYGIGSAVVSLQQAGYFFISTEVGAEVTEAALGEIEKEIEILKADLIPEQELDLVRNYMMGSLLGGLENAFSHADKFKNIFNLNLGYEYYDYYIKTIKTVSSEQLLQLAKVYLDFSKMEKVIVGKM